ncbi:hypothetical protein NMG60_11030082 [Bertholletia excelsa]
MRLLHGSSLPLYRLHHFTSYSTLNRPHFQVSYLMPHPFSLSLIDVVQETLQTLAANPCTSRSFSGVSTGYSDSDVDAECDDSLEGSKREDVPSKVDPIKVEKVCKVIDELFALDRNMEVVLDELGVNLSHDLVVNVLERFHHTRGAGQFGSSVGLGGGPGMLIIQRLTIR